MRREPAALSHSGRGLPGLPPCLSKPFTGKKALSQIAFYEGAEQVEEAQQFRVFGGGSAAAERLGKKSGKGVELGGAFTHTDIIFRARFS